MRNFMKTKSAAILLWMFFSFSFCIAENFTEEESFFLSSDDEIKKEFYSCEISDEIFSRMKGKTYKENCTVPLSSLNYLHILHCGKNGEVLEGEMVCSSKISAILLEIFFLLYKSEYVIEKVRLADDYNAVDEQSMQDNNTSCFNFRCISGTDKISMHGLGLAVDINPLYNPYIKTTGTGTVVEPAGSEEFTDRSKDFSMKITHSDLAYKLFTERGFEWGGDWKNLKDYQHFEIDLK